MPQKPQNLWLVRAGSHGEFEQKFLSENRIYLTWGDFNYNLAELPCRPALLELMNEHFRDENQNRLQNHSSQVWAFVQRIQSGDWVVLPSKMQPVIYVGRVKSSYQYNGQAADFFYHWRDVEWIGQEIPRSHFGQDLLYSFGAFMTICQISRNNALDRLIAMRERGWTAENIASIQKRTSPTASNADEPNADDDSYLHNLDELSRQQIVERIEQRFKGHDFTRLISAILRAKGYTVWQSPEGADGGADILASGDVMGFGGQRICVEVKSGTGTTDRPTVDKLLGAMTKFNADHGLFVAWGGFKQNVQKDMASSFFRLRLWSQNDVLEELFSVYDKLDDELKAQLPLKRTWMLVTQD